MISYIKGALGAVEDDVRGTSGIRGRSDRLYVFPGT